MLAYMPTETVQHILASGMPQYTQRTLGSSEAFSEDMRRVRERGFAIDEQEFESGISAVAALVFNLSNQPVASIAVAGPAYRLTRERMLEIGPVVVATACGIGQEMEMAVHPEVHPAENSPANTGVGG